ncbi:unnamed protein product [Cuscuta epithymum]|uniref:Protein kinase domain-containing protein n=1 Tax=Cuscuta epithymum TaxID=186058 RepID=A0AAV0DKH6_9ASTE|nr:unnamed protein product [Cuscuta epithymum]
MMSKLLPSPILLTLAVVLLTLPFHGNTLQNESSSNPERAILLHIKRHFSNPTHLSHWTSSAADHCNWPEVTCVDGSVTGIRLVDLKLNRTVPPFICDLRSLTLVDLNHNFFSGPFPTSLYNCSSLEFLDLSFNFFNGSIPADIHSLSPQLKVFNLSANSFAHGIPPAIGALKQLQELHLAMSFLSTASFPPEIGDLLNLQVLDLNDNPFSPQPIPSSFTNLKELRNLWIRNSNLAGEIPENLFSNATTPALEYLDLSGNGLSGNIPSGMFLMKNLTTLYLMANRLSGHIPQAVEAFNLNWIDLSNNCLAGEIPQGFGKLTKLEGLVLFMNQLTGEIPGSIGRLPALGDVRLFMNNLSGEIPPEFGRFSKLQILDVSTNNLVGSLPEGLCDNKVLESFIAFQNNLTGEIPKSLGDCSDSLISFRVEKNRLSGRIPDGLWTARNLKKLMVSDNLFIGELPAEKVGPNLSLVEMGNNRFSGEIPAGVSGWSNLVSFKAGYNLFTGGIPNDLTVLEQLSVLWVDGNQLSGSLPSEIISWKSLTSFKCNGNHLSGEIPSALGRLLNLNELDLSGNQFSGEIPPEIGRQLRLTSLNLSSNHLSGAIPAELENAAFDKSFLNNSGLCSTNPTSFGLSRNCSKGKSQKTDVGFVRVIAILVSVAAALVLVAILSIVFVAGRKSNDKTRQEGPSPDWKITPFYKLSFTESNIVSNLTESNVMGRGASGVVYQVALVGPLHSRGCEKVAVKRIWNCKSLKREFEAEVKILGTIRHYNIVKLLCGMCSSDCKLLVYEYMENRSLDLWIHTKRRRSSNWPPMGAYQVLLQWPTRLHIAIGTAQGLCYMHHSCSPPIVHRDVKSSNVLLDSEFNAKVADFGLARLLLKHGEANTTLSSVAAGSFGYIAPEYAHTTKVNEKIDVYSFGVILLELVTGREANDGTEELGLADWAWQHVRGGKAIQDVLDAAIKKPQYINEMEDVFKLGVFCTTTFPSARPTMKQVLQILLRTHPSPSPLGHEKMMITGSERDASPLLTHSRLVLDDHEFVSIV